MFRAVFSAWVTSGVLLLASAAVTAAPWIEPGDMRMRHSLQTLSDHGEISTPINTWPVMWAGVSQRGQVNSRSGGAVAMERAYVQFEQARYATPGWSGEFAVGAANQPRLLRGFNEQPREEGEVGFKAHWTGLEWAAGFEVQYADEPADDKNIRFDGSYLAHTGGDWVLGAGAIDRWWGPGWTSSLMLSSNARPVPSIWLNRTNPQGSDHPLLSWLGPWQLTLTLGQLESNREVPQARLLGMRFNFRPVSGLELGLSRLIHYGGGDEPQNASALWSALRVSEASGRSGEETSVQMAGVDFRYGTALGSLSGGFYGEAVGQVGEDQNLGRFMGLAGVDLGFPLGPDSQRWFLEFVDTTAGNIVGRPRENVAYEDDLYRTGDRYRGRALGSSLDSDAQALTLGMQHFFDSGRNLQLTLARARLNRSNNLELSMPSGDVDYAISRGAQDAFLAGARYEYPLWGGWATLDGQWSDRRIEIATADGSGRAQGTLTAGWRYRF